MDSQSERLWIPGANSHSAGLGRFRAEEPEEQLRCAFLCANCALMGLDGELSATQPHVVHLFAKVCKGFTAM